MSRKHAGNNRRAAAAARAVCGALFAALILAGCLQAPEEGPASIPRPSGSEAEAEASALEALDAEAAAEEPVEASSNETTPAPEEPAEPAPPPLQVVEGTIQAPSGDPYGHCAWLDGPVWAATGTEGTFSQRIEVDPLTWGTAFKIVASNGDIDIGFAGEAIEHSVQYTLRSLDGERGIIPRGAEKATICLFAGAQSAFLYIGGLPNAQQPEQIVQGWVEGPACGALDASVMSHGDGNDDPTTYRFDVDPSTWGKAFALIAHQTADLAIRFDVGTTPGASWLVEGRGFEPIEGVVPEGASEARVCVFAGGPSGFTYIAGAHGDP